MNDYYGILEYNPAGEPVTLEGPYWSLPDALAEADRLVDDARRAGRRARFTVVSLVELWDAEGTAPTAITGEVSS